MKLRLQKIIANAGIASRRKAEEMISQGKVSVNGQIITQLGSQFDPDLDHIKVEGRSIRSKKAEKVVYALYKPKSCVTTLDDPQGRDTIVKYFPDKKLRLFPVGRLDYDAEGLVLLTNDGDLANQIMHPTQHVWKQYFVKLKGNIKIEELDALRSGPVIDKQRRQPVRTRFLHFVNDKSWVSVSLQEGIKHHIKKMFQEIGYPVLKIKRYSIGNVELEEMRPGDIRKLRKSEIESLLTLVRVNS